MHLYSKTIVYDFIPSSVFLKSYREEVQLHRNSRSLDTLAESYWQIDIATVR